jgi:hypothetical protein
LQLPFARARPGGARVGRRVALAVGEDEVSAQRARRLQLRARRARVRAAARDSPLVARVAQRGHTLLPADGLDVVCDDSIRGGQTLRLRAHERGQGEEHDARSEHAQQRTPDALVVV